MNSFQSFYFDNPGFIFHRNDFKYKIIEVSGKIKILLFLKNITNLDVFQKIEKFFS